MVGLINMGDAPGLSKGEAIVQGIFMNYLVTDNEKQTVLFVWANRFHR